MSLSLGVIEAESYGVVYKEGGSGWKPEPQQKTFLEQYNHAVATPSSPLNPEHCGTIAS
jgi:hypothetical protein